MKVKSKLLAIAVTLCLIFCFTVQAYAATDIGGHWAQATIEKGLEMNIVTGFPDGTFQPNKNVTRAEFATMVNKAFGFTDADTDKKFSDVKEGDWFAEQVAIAARAGYIAGYTDGTFQPQKQCTRAEACVMIRKAAGMNEGAESALNVFKDNSSIPAFARSSISALVSAGLIKGYPDGTFGPQAQVTRAESLVMTYQTSTGDIIDVEEPDEKVSVTGVELNKITATISVGNTTKLEATVKPADATNKKVKWATSDEKIATVDSDGLVKGVKVGKADITVTTEDGNKTDICRISVTGKSTGGGGGAVVTKDLMTNIQINHDGVLMTTLTAVLDATVDKVEVIKDGNVIADYSGGNLTAPFSQSFLGVNAGDVLTVKATAKDGTTGSYQVTVTGKAPPKPAELMTNTVAEFDGVLMTTLTAVLDATVDKVEVIKDGNVIADYSGGNLTAPFSQSFLGVNAGDVLTVKATAKDGTTGSYQVTVTGKAPPKPAELVTDAVATFDGMMMTNLTAVLDASVEKIEVINDSKAQTVAIYPDKGKKLDTSFDETFIGAAKGDVLTIKATAGATVKEFKVTVK